MGGQHLYGNRHIRRRSAASRAGFAAFARLVADPARNAVSVNKTCRVINASLPIRIPMQGRRTTKGTPANAHAQGRCQSVPTGGRLVVIVPVASAAMVLSVLS